MRRLKAFLDRFGFRYEFLSSTECYKSGRFDQALLTVLRHYEKVRDVVLPTLGPERRATYSPFLARMPAHRTRAPGSDRRMERGCRDRCL